MSRQHEQTVSNNYTSSLLSSRSTFLVGAASSLYCVVVTGSVDVGLTIPELFVRGVKTEVTEATLKDMLDTILCARALLRLLHPLLQGHQHPRKNTQKINHQEVPEYLRATPYNCVPANQ